MVRREHAIGKCPPDGERGAEQNAERHGPEMRVDDEDKSAITAENASNPIADQGAIL